MACSPRAAKNWKVPTRMWLAATRVKTAPGSAPLAKDGLARDDCGKRPGRRDTKRVHRFADQVFTQHGPERCPAVAGARKGSGTRAFELNVTTTSVAVDHLAQEQRPPVAKLGHEAAELVAGVRLGQRRRSLGCLIAGKDPRAFLGIESAGIQSQFFSQFTVELNQPRLRHLRRLPGYVEALKFARIGIVEGEACGGRVVRDVCHGQSQSVSTQSPS